MMIRTMPLLIACAQWCALAAPAAAGDLPAAEDLFAKNAAAIGGDAIKDVKNMAAEFSFSMPGMGLSTNGESYIERPDKTYSMISLMAMGGSDFESGVNGDIVWQNNPQMGLRLLEGNERRMAIRGGWLDPFARWKDLWDTAETVAEETVEGAACYKVVLKQAHRIEQEGIMPFTIEYTAVRYNTDDIPADVFEVPQGIKEMARQ